MVQPAGVSLEGGAYELAVAPPRVIVTGAPVAGLPLVEHDYARTPLVDPVFSTAPLRPLERGAPVEQLGDLVRQLLDRCARGPGGYSPEMGLAIEVALAGVDGGSGRFEVRIAPAPDPTRGSHAALAGRHDGFFNDRWGANRLEGTLTLEVTWRAA